MELYLDEQPLDQDLLGSGTLEDGLRGVQDHLGSARRILVAFRCDGRDIPEPRIADALSKPLTSYHRVELFSATREDLVTDTMTHASASLDDTDAVVQRIAALLIEGRAAEAIGDLGECLKVWQQVHDAIGKALAILETDLQQTKVRDLPLQDALARPKEVLVQIRQALMVQDHVLLADILQYEFAEVTDLWHTLISQIRRQADDLREAAPAT